jgi:hypothetical protein
LERAGKRIDRNRRTTVIDIIDAMYLFSHGGVDATATKRYVCSGGLLAATVDANTSGLNRYDAMKTIA